MIICPSAGYISLQEQEERQTAGSWGDYLFPSKLNIMVTGAALSIAACCNPIGVRKAKPVKPVRDGQIIVISNNIDFTSLAV